MPGPTVNWKKLDTGALRSEIVEGGRYQLASPSTVTGNPSLAMQAGQSCTVRVYIGGTLYPDASLTVNGTTPVAILNAIGQPLTGQEKFDLVIEVAMPYGQNLTATDEPNGSPTSPFTSEAQRTDWATANLATLRSGVSTVWGPGNVEYVWNGPLATDWQGIRGPYLGSAENPYPASTTTAELVALAATSKPGQIIHIANPALPLIGYSRMQCNAGKTAYLPIPGEAVFGESGGAFSQSGGFSAGTSILAYSGPEIPECLIPSSGSFVLAINAGVSDSSSTASTSLGCSVSQAASAPSDYNYSIVSQVAAASPGRLGMFSYGRAFRRAGTEIRAFAATYAVTAAPELVIGYAPGSGLRFRFYVKAGAATNVADIVSYSATWRPG